MSYDNSKVLCMSCGWRVRNLTKHYLHYHANKNKKGVTNSEDLVPFENLSDEDKRHFADGWLEKENG